ncbi:MAG: hypothetical protein WBA68_07220 [Alteraurantiacibacter sp.]
MFDNAICPLLDNYHGRLTLHGSAVAVGGHAVAFVGLSRRGKTTLAAAMAKSGYPFLCEDVLRVRRDGPAYVAQPSRPVMRLSGDSLCWLSGEQDDGGGKRDVPAGDGLPHVSGALPLSRIYILGDGAATSVECACLQPAKALAALLQHAFVLDSEDKEQMRAHFSRLSDLASAVPCRALDYPRRFNMLPLVVQQVAGEPEG